MTEKPLLFGKYEPAELIVMQIENEFARLVEEMNEEIARMCSIPEEWFLKSD